MVKIDRKHVWAYIQGTVRMFLYTYAPFMIRPHIKQQFLYRKKKAKACVENGSCIVCGCKMPDRLFSDIACSLEDIRPLSFRKKLKGTTKPCYKKMLTKKEFNHV